MPADILATLTYDQALTLTGHTYRVEGADAELTVTSVKRAAERGARPKELKRDAFSIFFRSPAFLPQRMYALAGERENFPGIFIVPVGRSADGYEYEAVFT